VTDISDQVKMSGTVVGTSTWTSEVTTGTVERGQEGLSALWQQFANPRQPTVRETAAKTANTVAALGSGGLIPLWQLVASAAEDLGLGAGYYYAGNARLVGRYLNWGIVKGALVAISFIGVRG
jgi:hypothetical protein